MAEKKIMQDIRLGRNVFETIEQLKQLAMDEHWDWIDRPTGKNPILYNYVCHTYERIVAQNKLFRATSVDKRDNIEKEYAIFNTGLATNLQEEIFAFLTKYTVPNAKQDWVFIGWRKRSDTQLKMFPKAPEPASYFEDPSDLLYDTRLELIPDLDHIVNDRSIRFPPSLIGQPRQLKNFLDGAIHSTLNRIKRNYKTAVPQFYNNKIQLLLPLCFYRDDRADLALAVEKIRDDNGQPVHYRANTCLTLDMAINNARLIAKPDNEWLKY